MANIHNILTIFLDPLSSYNQNKLKGTWIFKQVNPFLSNIPALEAASLFPVIIKKNEKVIIRDKETNKILMAIYRNRIGPDALQIMQNTVKEMMQVRIRVARSSEIKKLNQGSMAIAGYLLLNFTILLYLTCIAYF